MLELWARSRMSKEYEFITYTSYDNMYYDAGNIDPTYYYEILVMRDKEHYVLYEELEKPMVRRKKYD